jgi:hydrogenase maturation factor/ElaB/YqjD/DUF883 family membrane-anchored ribosome-binding protein
MTSPLINRVEIPGLRPRRPRQSLMEMLALIRKAQTQQLAQQGLMGAFQAEQSAAIPGPQGLIGPSILPTPDPGFMRRVGLTGEDPVAVIGGVKVGKTLWNAYNTLTSGVAGLGLGDASQGMPGIPSIPGIPPELGQILGTALKQNISPFQILKSEFRPPTEEEAERKSLARTTQMGVLKGQISPWEALKVGQEIQSERPLGQQLVSEMTSPLGLAEFAIPFGAIPRIGQKLIKVAKPAITAVSRRVPHIPPPERIMELVNNPATAERLRNSKIPGVRLVMSVINPNQLADPTSIGHRAVVHMGVAEEMAPEMSNLMVQRVLSRGDPRRLFNLGEDFRSTTIRTAKGRGATVNEIAQFPQRFTLSADQTAWLDNFADRVSDLNAYLREEGIVSDVIFTQGVKGRYFPNIWKMWDDFELVKSGQIGGQGSNPFYLKSRFYEEAQDAINAGFSPLDPMASIDTLFKSMYKQVLYKQVDDTLRKAGNTTAERLSPKFKNMTGDAARRVAGLKSASDLIRKFSFAGPVGPAIGVSLVGRKAANQWAPDIMREFDYISNLLEITPNVRRDMLTSLRGQAQDALKEAQKNLKKTKSDLKDAMDRAKHPRGDYGEIQFQRRGISNMIFTPDMPDNVLQHLFPEHQISNIRTLPKADLENISKALEKQTKDWLVWTNDVSSVMRTLQAGTDLGVIGIHGIVTMFNNPSAWSKAMGVSLEAMRDPVSMAKFIDDHWDTVLKLAERNQLGGAGSEYIEAARRGGLLHRGLSRLEAVPSQGIGRLGLATIGKRSRGYLEAYERQFNGWLVSAKIHMWEAMEPMALASGDPKALDELASHLSKSLGHISMANMGIKPTMRNIMGSFLMFAPRYRMATYGLIMDAFRGGLRGDLARASLGRLMAGGLITYSLIADRLGQKPNLDPRSGKFLTVKIGDSNMGIGSSFVSVARFGANILNTAFTDPSKFVTLNSSDQPMIKFARAQMAPLGGTIWDMVSGRNYIGEPTTKNPDGTRNWPGFGPAALEGILPFYLGGLSQYPRAGWSSVLGEYVGLRAYPVSQYERALDLADIETLKKYPDMPNIQGYNDLTVLAKNKLLEEHPNIQAAFDESNRLFEERSRGSGEKISRYRVAARDIADRADELMEAEYALLQKPGETKYTGRRFRIMEGHINWQRNKEYDALEAEHEEARDALNELGSNPDAKVEDIAFNDYRTRIMLGDWETEDGEFDFKKRDKEIEKWRRRWGEQNYQYVQERIEQGMNPLQKQLRSGRQQHRQYWELGHRILEKVGRTDLTADWATYMSSRSFHRKAMAAANPFLAQVERAQSLARKQMRDRDPELDKFLYRWQYTDTLRPTTPNRLQLQETLLKY